MELLGERWAMLVLRELAYGPRRFSELKSDLPGISANVLTQRLAHLETRGLVRRTKLPPPASVQVYEATEWGLEAVPTIAALGRWAARSPWHDPTLPMSHVSIIMSLQTLISPGRAQGFDARIGFRIGPDPFTAHLHDGRLDIVRAEAENPDFSIAAADASLIAAVVYGGQPLAALEQTGGITVEGDHALAERFVTWFPLPSKVG